MDNSYVKFKQFWTILGIMTTILIATFGYVLNAVGSLANKIDDYQISIVEIKTQLSSIQMDLLWIKKDLEKK